MLLSMWMSAQISSETIVAIKQANNLIQHNYESQMPITTTYSAVIVSTQSQIVVSNNDVTLFYMSDKIETTPIYSTYSATSIPQYPYVYIPMTHMPIAHPYNTVTVEIPKLPK